jgi:hypothetical protein
MKMKWERETDAKYCEGMGLVRYNKLMASHYREAAKHGAVFHNLGWAIAGYGIASKTSEGVLESEITQNGNGPVRHWWS